ERETGDEGPEQDQLHHRLLRLAPPPHPGRTGPRAARTAVGAVLVGQRLPVPDPGAMPRRTRLARPARPGAGTAAARERVPDPRPGPGLASDWAWTSR